MAFEQFGNRRVNWRWTAAVTLFLLAFIGLLSGVSLSERPDVVSSGLLTKAYYSLGLFVVGGLDIGTPNGGPALAQIALWLAYFGAPLLTASAVIEAVIRVMSPHRWQLTRLKEHIVIVGMGELTTSYLRVLRDRAPTVPIVVVGETSETTRQQELEQAFGVIVAVGDITNDFLLNGLHLERAAGVLLLGGDDFQSYEAASKILRIFPHLQSRVILHCDNLRFLRAMEDTGVAKLCSTFNSYHLAATSLVNDHLIGHFRKTAARDIVVLAGFGRFGQTVLEQLQDNAQNEIDTVAVIDVDADRRVLVAEEQRRIGENYRRLIFEGDISHPEVWSDLSDRVDLSHNQPTIILGTGRAADNLRTGLWLKENYPNAFVFVRTNDKSELAVEVGAEHGIRSFSIKQLVEDNISLEWLGNPDQG
ncbi:MAG: NAD-binding protein [Pseudomonadales bacterium]